MYSDNRGVEPQASGEVQTSLYPRVTREEELERQPGHIVDLMATAVDLGNATYPDTVEDLSEKHPERLEKMTQQWDGGAALQRRSVAVRRRVRDGGRQVTVRPGIS